MTDIVLTELQSHNICKKKHENYIPKNTTLPQVFFKNFSHILRTPIF